MVVAGTYDPYLVALSILVACVASYTALDLSAHVEPAGDLHVACGWRLPRSQWEAEYGRQSASPLRLVLSGIFMGLGIAGMHYTGMAAMRGHVELSYDPLLVALSLVIAIGASTVALWLAFRTTDLGQKLVAAVVMGLAISGMHYTGMRAAILSVHGPVHEAQVNASIDQTNLALAVAGITFIILAFASVASLFERKRAEEALRQAQANLAHVTRVMTLGELTASIAHEVSQPLAAVVTNSQACLRWLALETPRLDEARAAVERIVRDSNRASEVIQRIRALAKRTEPQMIALDIAARAV
jgi:NO-binding membrane sensor protein with MHYT domain